VGDRVASAVDDAVADAVDNAVAADVAVFTTGAVSWRACTALATSRASAAQAKIRRTIIC
ncbi:MAG TPA: hypothetical protein VFU95_12715, partial [Telluria sp.]|nr:hypothetical protein [Telluria sp.]